MGVFSCLLASLALSFLGSLFSVLSGFLMCFVLQLICLRWKWQHFCHDLTLLEMMFFVLCSVEKRTNSLLINAGGSLAPKREIRVQIECWKSYLYKKLSRLWELNMGEDLPGKVFFDSLPELWMTWWSCESETCCVSDFSDVTDSEGV